VEIDIGSEQVSQGIVVHVRVRLSARELNRLFLKGDTLIQLPLEGAADDVGGAPMPRMSMFLSEIAGAPDGFLRTFSDAACADSFARVVRDQISTALEAS
jgi:hypothetical protein